MIHDEKPRGMDKTYAYTKYTSSCSTDVILPCTLRTDKKGSTPNISDTVRITYPHKSWCSNHHLRWCGRRSRLFPAGEKHPGATPARSRHLRTRPPSARVLLLSGIRGWHFFGRAGSRRVMFDLWHRMIATDAHFFLVCAEKSLRHSDDAQCIVQERLPPPPSRSGYYCMWVRCNARTPSPCCLLPTQGWVPSSYHSSQGAFFNTSIFNKCLYIGYLCRWKWSQWKNLKRFGGIFFYFSRTVKKIAVRRVEVSEAVVTGV